MFPVEIEVEKEIGEDEYEEMITELYGTFTIGQCEFDAGRILRELDPIAFRVGMSDETSDSETKYKCGECGEIYDDEDEAEDCCKEE